MRCEKTYRLPCSDFSRNDYISFVLCQTQKRRKPAEPVSDTAGLWRHFVGDDDALHAGLPESLFSAGAGVLFLIAAGIQLLPRFSGKLTLGYLGLLLAFAFWKARRIVEGIQYIVNLVYQKAHNTDVVYFTIHTKNDLSGSVLLTCICIAGLLAVFLAFFTMRKPHFVLTASVTFLLIEPGLYFGLPVSVFAMAPLAYWCGMLAMRFSMLGDQERTGSFGKTHRSAVR